MLLKELRESFSSLYFLVLAKMHIWSTYITLSNHSVMEKRNIKLHNFFCQNLEFRPMREFDLREL